MAITTAQIRGARGILNWSQADLAERTGISATSIGSIENGQTSPRTNTLIQIRKAFEDSGIEFIGQEGIRLRTGQVRTYSGKQGFLEFFDHLYNTVKDQGDEIFASNVEEKKFLKLAGEHSAQHMERMSSIKNLSFKVLLKENDFDFTASEYVEYRWLPQEQFSSVPFYTFGKQLAIFLLDDEPTVVVLDYPAVAEAYRLQFKNMWEKALIPQRAKAS